MKRRFNWFQRGLMGAIMLLLSVGIAFAQDVTIKGTVTGAEDGMPIPGVSVVQKGTTNGTITDIDGNYTITAPTGAVVAYSFVGMKMQEITVGGQTTINITLQPESIEMEGVVVTALGIKKKEKSLTYSTQQVKGEELVRAKDVNLVNSLSGKSAGVVINRSSSGVGGSTKVNIRGARSLNGNNQPLYVIDGVPLLNSSNEQPVTSIGGSNDGASRDGGDGISNLNPDDIASISILKGASAAALYGTQAANGVILITTKRGQAGATRVTFSSNTTFEKATALPEFQDSYGASEGGYSWGAPISSGKDNTEELFDTGVTTINSLSVSSGNEKYQTYFSYANTNAKGIINSNKLNKHNINLRQSAKMFDNKLSLDANVNLVNQKVENRPTPGGYYFNPLVGLYRFPRGMDITPYKEGFEKYDELRKINVQDWHKPDESWEQNPWWLLNRTPSEDTRNRVITSLTAKWDINDWLYVQARGNVDYTVDKFNHNIYASTNTALSGTNGRHILYDYQEMQKYGDILLSLQREFGDFNLSATLGSSINDLQLKSARLDSRPGNLRIPNYFAIANMEISYIEQQDVRKQLQSVFGTAQLGFKDYLFLDVTARNDWSSALAYTKSASSGFFYPSVGLTAIVSDMVSLPDWIDFGKVRGSVSNVGNDIPVYLSNPLNSLDANGNVIFNSEKPFDDLKPEISSSVEFGTEWRFFASKLSVDLTYYKTNTKNQFFRLPAPAGAKYSYYYVNAGNIENKGFEAVLGIIPVANDNFTWTSNINFSVNRNKVVELHPDLEEFTFGDMTSNSYWMKVVEGGEIGDIYGLTFERDEQGNIKYDEDGLPVKGSDYTKVANTNPDFSLGWNNNISYKNWSLGFLLDGRFGGDVISLTQADLDSYGVSKVSGDARDLGYVELEGNRINDVEGYYRRVGGRDGVTENYVYDATSVRLREMTLNYRLPKELLMKTKLVESASIGFVGRNLWYLYKDAPFDPDNTMSTGNNLQGVDVFGMPAVASYGFNIQLTF